METANTPPNRALAQAVNSRIAADAVMLNAKSAVWRLTGVGAMCALIGLGVGMACFGFSYIHDPRTSVQKMAQAFAEALEKTTLTTTGEVKLDPQSAVKLDANGAQVKVDPTSTIHLDASGTVVRLDPNAMVNVGGVASEVSRPTPHQLNPNTVPHSPKVNVVTNYTVFKTVAHGKGAVVTGWVFTSNEEVSPRREYCYYQEPIREGVHARFDLATDGQLLKSESPATFDRKSAAADCVWFGGGPTRSY